MYHLVFYFFYRILAARDPNQKVFTAIMFTFIVMSLHILAVLKLMVYFTIIDNFPVFSSSYLYNKLSWYPFLMVPLILVIVYFNKKRTTQIITQRSQEKPFFTIRNILTFSLTLAIPIVIFILFLLQL